MDTWINTCIILLTFITKPFFCLQSFYYKYTHIHTHPHSHYNFFTILKINGSLSNIPERQPDLNVSLLQICSMYAEAQRLCEGFKKGINDQGALQPPHHPHPFTLLSI